MALAIIKMSLDFIAALAWPAVVLAALLLFRDQVRNLAERITSGEVGSAKITFKETVGELLSAQVDKLSDQGDPEIRSRVADEIRGIADALGAINPASLALLINAAEGPHHWTGHLNRTQFAEIERLQLAQVVDTQLEGKPAIRLKLTEKGRALLTNMGVEINPYADA